MICSRSSRRSSLRIPAFGLVGVVMANGCPGHWRGKPASAAGIGGPAPSSPGGTRDHRGSACRGAGPDPGEIPRHAVRRHTRLARAEGAVLGAGGALTAAPDLVALAWLQSRMVFFVAAAHGYDPGHPMRPAELLALQGMYETPAEARAALDRAGRPLASALLDSGLRGRGETTLRHRLLGGVSQRMAMRFGARLVPFLSSAVSAVQNGSLTADLGVRAERYYGG